jgi:predicted O-methyltransferase YrrM
VSKLPPGIFTDHRFFELYQSKGWHATPVHFYQPIPDTRELSPKLWEEQSAMVGLDINEDEQITFIRELSQFIDEYHSVFGSSLLTGANDDRFRQFQGVDAALLYSVIRRYAPRRIIEIGSGGSSLLATDALDRNAEVDSNQRGVLTVIDPYPQRFLDKSLRAGQLVRKKVEEVPFEQFESLDENDLLFIDSSHTVRIGGDVQYIVLEILPRLKRGVLVHFHDIFLPLEYPREWILKKRLFWTEQYLLQAFLAYNDCFHILWSGGYMDIYCREELTNQFPYYDAANHIGGSFWIRRVK